MEINSAAEVHADPAMTNFGDLSATGAVAKNAVARSEAPKTAPPLAEITIASPVSREGGDQVNRFLLCALIRQSAKQIKASAARIGEALPMTMIVRGVLRSYREAAADDCGPLARPDLDIPGLKKLNDKVLTDEIARLLRDRVTDSQARLANARRLGDVTTIKAEEDGLGRAIESLRRLAEPSTTF